MTRAQRNVRLLARVSQISARPNEPVTRQLDRVSQITVEELPTSIY